MSTAIVIGGGIAGCSTAFALSQRGISVTLLERNDALAREASGNPVAMLYPKLSTKLDSTSLLAASGFQFTLDLLKQLPSSDTFFKACGLIQLAFDAREHVRQQALLHNEYSVLLEHLDTDAASEKCGLTLKTGGIYLPQAGWVKPALLCETLCNSGLIQVITSTNALTIKKISGHWQVFDNKNAAFEADIVVICSANDIKQFKHCTSINITSVRGQINFFDENNVSRNINSIISSDHFIGPSIDGMHSVGTTYGPNDTNPNLSEADTKENMNALHRISPLLAESIQHTTTNGRVAWRSATSDYIPLAGQLLDEGAIRVKPPRYNANPKDLPWLEGLYVNAGHGSKGMITAPICGELIASLVTNSNCPIDAKLVSKLNPSRFLLRDLGLKQLANSL